MRGTRASPAPWRSAMNGWPRTTVSTGGSRRAMARSSSIFHPNAAGTAPRSISAPLWGRLTRPAVELPLTGWFAGPKANRVSSFSEAALIDMGLASLAEIFDLPLDRIRRNLVASRAINWGNDRFARGAYSYATPKTRQAQSLLRKSNGDAILFSGEALYAGPDMGTVEAALASGQETAQTILTGSPVPSPHTR